MKEKAPHINLREKQSTAVLDTHGVLINLNEDCNDAVQNAVSPAHIRVDAIKDITDGALPSDLGSTTEDGAANAGN